MSAAVHIEGEELRVVAESPRMDGDNLMIGAMQKARVFERSWRAATLDLAVVEYLNSLGITELVNIHRGLIEKNPQLQFRLCNVDRRVNAILELVEIQNIAQIELRD